MTTKQLAVNEQQEQLVLQRDEEIIDRYLYLYFLPGIQHTIKVAFIIKYIVDKARHHLNK
jgi:hypothetical protein